ncbi:hypothetical protein K402DRAFT_405729 [Aulographum hederae CBS 113979]|uniref:Uncharacterized protein n=1 Tax=Aulographum hederae CBS 113979 TaxID=1176131 RepID=A0A6G1GVX7_9PEZI|nr:hypothetical protein K402DRAFT_405729 [Aulographum hederae CBS 113979]
MQTESMRMRFWIVLSFLTWWQETIAADVCTSTHCLTTIVTISSTFSIPSNYTPIAITSTSSPQTITTLPSPPSGYPPHGPSNSSIPIPTNTTLTSSDAKPTVTKKKPHLENPETSLQLPEPTTTTRRRVVASFPHVESRADTVRGPATSFAAVPAVTGVAGGGGGGGVNPRNGGSSEGGGESGGGDGVSGNENPGNGGSSAGGNRGTDGSSEGEHSGGVSPPGNGSPSNEYSITSPGTPGSSSEGGTSPSSPGRSTSSSPQGTQNPSLLENSNSDTNSNSGSDSGSNPENTQNSSQASPGHNPNPDSDNNDSSSTVTITFASEILIATPSINAALLIPSASDSDPKILTPDGVTFMSVGQTISVAPNGAIIAVDTSGVTRSYLLPAEIHGASATPSAAQFAHENDEGTTGMTFTTLPAAVFTLANGEVYTATNGVTLVVAGQTIYPGGPAVTVDGEIVRLGFEGVEISPVSAGAGAGNVNEGGGGAVVLTEAVVTVPVASGSGLQTLTATLSNNAFILPGPSPGANPTTLAIVGPPLTLADGTVVSAAPDGVVVLDAGNGATRTAAVVTTTLVQTEGFGGEETIRFSTVTGSVAQTGSQTGSWGPVETDVDVNGDLQSGASGVGRGRETWKRRLAVAVWFGVVVWVF